MPRVTIQKLWLSRESMRVNSRFQSWETKKQERHFQVNSFRKESSTITQRNTLKTQPNCRSLQNSSRNKSVICNIWPFVHFNPSVVPEWRELIYSLTVTMADCT